MIEKDNPRSVDRQAVQAFVDLAVIVLLHSPRGETALNLMLMRQIDEAVP